MEWLFALIGAFVGIATREVVVRWSKLSTGARVFAMLVWVLVLLTLIFTVELADAVLRMNNR